jgi:uncharacterized membrane protein
MATVAVHGVTSGRVRKFIRTTVVGGLVFLVPVVVLIVLAGKAMKLLRRLAEPLAERLPVDTLAGLVVADAVVILLLLIACFFAGLLARLSFANRVVKKAETGVLWRIPGYGFIKGLTDSLDHSASAAAMRPVLVHFDDYAQLAFEIDQIGDGRKVIFLPDAPDPRAGSVVVVDPHRVEPLPISFVAATRMLRGLGRGLGPCLSDRLAGDRGGPPPPARAA